MDFSEKTPFPKDPFLLTPFFRDIPTGLLQHVLTVLVFWSWFLVLPRLPPWSRSLRFFPWASILLYGPLEIAWMCCPQLPHHPCKNGTYSTCFYSTGAPAKFLIFFFGRRGRDAPGTPFDTFFRTSGRKTQFISANGQQYRKAGWILAIKYAPRICHKMRARMVWKSLGLFAK